jgi:dihydrofolate reductase
MTPPNPRRLFVSMMTSLDGLIEGPDRELDWPHQTPEFTRYCDEMLDDVDLMLFGRVSYEMMVQYWPAAEATPANPADALIAPRMNRCAKIVLSRTLERATWANTRILRDDVTATLAALKRQPGKDIAVFGGAGIISSLTRAGLVDEYRLIVQPVVLGRGRPLFQDLDRRIPMTLARTTTLGPELVMLTYRPAPVAA